jgi:hypothetical protein
MGHHPLQDAEWSWFGYSQEPTRFVLNKGLEMKVFKACVGKGTGGAIMSVMTRTRKRTLLGHRGETPVDDGLMTHDTR